MKTGIIILAVILFGSSISFSQAPPVAKKVSKTDTIHGMVRIDHYSWLQDRNNPEVLEYIEAENAYTESVMGPVKKLREKLYKEMISRLKKTDMSLPYKYNGYWYYSKMKKSKMHPVYCRKKGSMDNKEEEMIDVNKFIKKHQVDDVHSYTISPDSRYMTITMEDPGSAQLMVWIKDLEKDELLPDTLIRASSIVWANDNQTLFYTQEGITGRHHSIYKHKLGSSQRQDKIMLHETDPIYEVYLHKSKSGRFIFVGISSTTKSEYRYLNADTPEEEFVIIHPREENHWYSAAHFQDKFYFLSDKNAENFKLMATPVNKPSFENWEEIVPHREDVILEDFDVFENYLVLTESHQGIHKIRVIGKEEGNDRYVPFSEEAYVAHTGFNPDYQSGTLRFAYSSLTVPYSVFEYDMEKGVKKLLKREEVLGGFDPSRYESKRMMAVSEDGTEVPVSYVYKKGLQKDGKNPVLIEGYGSFGSSFDPYFNSNYLNLLDRGFIFAIAHVRGGSDLGEDWHKQGKQLKKKNSFNDFIACTELLITEGYTSKGLIAAQGANAGGLLLGAVVNKRPDLYKAVILGLPHVDLINSMIDPNIRPPQAEYEEWGHPGDKESFEYMLSYSPYENVKAGEYPHMLFTSGISDQVGFWEPAKMVAKLRDLKTDNNQLLLKVELSGRHNYYREIALEQAFLLMVLGITE